MKLKAHLLIATPLLLSPSLHAADQTWKNDGPNNNWSTSAGNENWDLGVVWTPGNNAIFGGSAEPITLTTGTTVGNITFNSDGYSITGSTLTLGASTIDTGANNATIGSILAGTSLTKLGGGKLTLSSGNSYTGATTVNGGTLELVTGSSIAGGAITIGASGTFRDTRAPGSGLVEGTTTMANNVSGSGIWNLAPTDSSQYRAFTFTGNWNSFTGTLNYGAGAFTQVANNSRLPGSAGTINVAAGGEIYLDNNITYAGNITIAGDGIASSVNPPGGLRAALHLYNSTVSGLITLAANARIGAGNAGPVSTLSGGINTAGNTVTFINNTPNGASGSLNVTGAITGTGAVMVSSPSAGGFTLTLSGANTYAGDTTVTSGTMSLGANERIPNGIGKGNLSVDGTLDLNGKTEMVNSLSGSGTINGGSGTLTVGDTDSTSTFAGSLRGSASLVKTGTGTLSLTGTNSDSLGSITVSGGTVDVTGTVLAGGTLSVNNGGTLSGSGTINRATTVNPGGILAPAGSNIGSMTFNGALQFNAGGKLLCQVNKTGGVLTQDQLLAASVTYSGTLELEATGDALANGDFFTLVNATGYNGAFTAFSLPTLPAGLSWDTSSLSVNGTISVVNTVAPPTLSLAPGGYVGAQSVTLSSAAGSTIHYTTDGSDPSTSGTKISVASPASGIVIPNDTASFTIRAYATKTGQSPSAPVTAIYSTVTTPQWNVDSDGAWSEVIKWKNNVIPDGVGIPVDFNTVAQTADANIIVDSNRTVGSLTFGNTNGFNWQLSNQDGAVLTLATSSGVPTIQVIDQTTTVNAPLAGTQGLTKTGAGDLVLNVSNSYSGGTTLTQGTTSFTNPGVFGVGGISVGGGAGNVALLLRTAAYLSSPITINSQTGGSVTLGIASDYNAGGSLHGFTGGITLNGDVTLQSGPDNIGNRTDFPGVISGTGNVTINDPSASGFKVIFGSNDSNPGLVNTWTGGLTVNAGAVLQLGAGTAIGNGIPDAIVPMVNGDFKIALGGVEAINGLNGSGTLAFNAASDGLNVGGLNGNGSFSGPISGPGSFTKSGTGTQTLSGACTHTGATNVSAGTLVLAGSTAAESAVAVASGATLAGTGTASGTVSAAGTLAPAGNSTGQLTLGNTTLTGTYVCQIDGASSDRIATGTLNLTGSALVVTEVSPGTAFPYTILTYTPGSLTGTITAPSGYILDYSTNGEIKLNQAGPGFSAWAAANAPGQTMDMDHDGDGVANGIEYFMGLSGNAFTSLPVPNGSHTVTWPMGASYSGVYGGDYLVQVSDNLSTWTPVAVGDVVIVPNTSVAYTLPIGTKKFTRLVVTGP